MNAGIEIKEYEVDIRTTFYDTVRVKASSSEQAATLARQVEPCDLIFIDTEIDAVREVKE